MKVFLVVCLLSLSVAAPLSEDGKAKRVSNESENDGQGNYKFSFKTTNGIVRKEIGTLVNIGEPNEHLEVRGLYSYTDPEGKSVVVSYTADENGYNILRPHISLPVGSNVTTYTSMVPYGLPPGVVASLLG